MGGACLTGELPHGFVTAASRLIASQDNQPSNTELRHVRRKPPLPGWPITIRGGGDPSRNMVIEPFVRMGPPPRGLAAEANDCFMVRPQHGANRIQGCNAKSRVPTAGSPRVIQTA
ncbi:MAG: hypothetical protein QOF70_2364, partial [Acetobacteraceae bacterium]|nr:hypothetical protein [Acetobacteraceae bacterium]